MKKRLVVSLVLIILLLNSFVTKTFGEELNELYSMQN